MASDTSWKEEAKPHLVDPAAATDSLSLDNFADGYAYVASEWSDGPWCLLQRPHQPLVSQQQC